jgi:hypothetical protein
MLARMLSSNILKFKSTIALKHDRLRHRFIQTVLAVSVCVIISQSLVKHFLLILYKMISSLSGITFQNDTGILISVSDSFSLYKLYKPINVGKIKGNSIPVAGSGGL